MTMHCMDSGGCVRMREGRPFARGVRSCHYSGDI